MTTKKISNVGFVLIPEFPLLSFACVVDAMRMTNRHVEKQLYSWRTMTLDGKETVSSCGMKCVPDASVFSNTFATTEFDLVFVVAGAGSENIQSQTLLTQLVRWSQQGKMLGGLTLGSYFLAQAGLLDGYQSTVHWEFLDVFKETYPKVKVTKDVITIDRNRVSSSGATASLDLMLQLISIDHGESLAKKVSDLCIYHQPRDQHDSQRMPLRTRIGAANQHLIHAVEYLESLDECPFSKNDLISVVGLSGRQIERLFRQYLSQTPRQYHAQIRLERARKLLQQTCMPIIDIAIACGFSTASHFTKCYKDEFGNTPSHDRLAVKSI